MRLQNFLMKQVGLLAGESNLVKLVSRVACNEQHVQATPRRWFRSVFTPELPRLPWQNDGIAKYGFPGSSRATTSRTLVPAATLTRHKYSSSAGDKYSYGVMSLGPRGRPLDAPQSTDVYFSRGPCNALGYSLFSSLILRQRGQRLQPPPPSTAYTGVGQNAGQRESRECDRVSVFEGNRRWWSRESLNFNTKLSLCCTITPGNPFTPCTFVAVHVSNFLPSITVR